VAKIKWVKLQFISRIPSTTIVEGDIVVAGDINCLVTEVK